MSIGTDFYVLYLDYDGKLSIMMSRSQTDFRGNLRHSRSLNHINLYYFITDDHRKSFLLNGLLLFFSTTYC